MVFFRSVFFLVLFSLLFACTSNQNKVDHFKNFRTLVKSEQFSISKQNDNYLLSITQASKGNNRSDHYLLYPRGKSYDSSLKDITHFIPYPIASSAITSTTHLGYLEALGMSDHIIGATNLELFFSPKFNSLIEEGKVASIGGQEVNEEVLIRLAPDVLFTFALNKANYDRIEELRRSGNAVVLINEYLEAKPLEKASWLIFFACFFGEDKVEKAFTYLSSIEDQYNNLKELCKLSKEQPKVMMGFPWKGSWFVSGGRSYQANFFKDASADYIWSHIEEEGGVPLDIEVVLKEGMEADFWINPGLNQDLDQILASDQRFQYFPAFDSLRVYSNYKRMNELGANDYWEKGVVRPDLLLNDLAIIFHPELFDDSNLYFYKRLSYSE